MIRKPLSTVQDEGRGADVGCVLQPEAAAQCRKHLLGSLGMAGSGQWPLPLCKARETKAEGAGLGQHCTSQRRGPGPADWARGGTVGGSRHGADVLVPREGGLPAGPAPPLPLDTGVGAPEARLSPNYRPPGRHAALRRAAGCAVGSHVPPPAPAPAARASPRTVGLLVSLLPCEHRMETFAQRGTLPS